MATIPCARIRCLLANEGRQATQVVASEISFTSHSRLRDLHSLVAIYSRDQRRVDSFCLTRPRFAPHAASGRV